MAKQLSKDQLKAFFARKRAERLPNGIIGDVPKEGRVEWNNSTINQRERILDMFSVKELRKFKMEKMKK